MRNKRNWDSLYRCGKCKFVSRSINFYSGPGGWACPKCGAELDIIKDNIGVRGVNVISRKGNK